MHILRNAGPEGLSRDPEALSTGRNSGYQAMNLALLAGASRVILIGYDAKEPAAGQAAHWFGEHPRMTPVSAFAMYRQSFKNGAAAIKAAGLRVINSSPGSAIECFERMELEQALRL